MKHCPRCDKDKDVSEFGKNSKRKDGLQPYCKGCRKAIDAESYLSSENRRESIKKTRDANNAHNLSFMRRYKRMCGCKICGEREPVALDLHHRNPAEKDFSPSATVSCSIHVMKAEIRKCVVLCANCHRKVHAGILKI